MPEPKVRREPAIEVNGVEVLPEVRPAARVAQLLEALNATARRLGY